MWNDCIVRWFCEWVYRHSTPASPGTGETTRLQCLAGWLRLWPGSSGRQSPPSDCSRGGEGAAVTADIGQTDTDTSRHTRLGDNITHNQWTSIARKRIARSWNSQQHLYFSFKSKNICPPAMLLGPVQMSVRQWRASQAVLVPDTSMQPGLARLAQQPHIFMFLSQRQPDLLPCLGCAKLCSLCELSPAYETATAAASFYI